MNPPELREVTRQNIQSSETMARAIKGAAAVACAEATTAEAASSRVAEEVRKRR